MSTGVSKKVVGQSTAYVASGTAQWNLEQLKGFSKFGARKKGYLRRLTDEVNLVINNSTGGALVIQRRQIYNFLKTCRLHTQEHDFVDAKLSAGQVLWFREFTHTGRIPEVFTAAGYSVPANSSLTVNIVLIMAQYDMRGVSREDEMIVADQFDDGGTLEMSWETSTTLWGAGLLIDASTGHTLTAELVPRDEFRIGTLTKIEEKQQQSMNDTITPNQVYFTDIFALAVQPVGQLTQVNFAAADFTTSNLTFDGTKVNDNSTPQSLVSKFNSQIPQSSEAFLPQWQGGTCFALPLVHLDPSSGKKTKLAYAKGKPSWEAQGALSGGQPRLYNRYIVPSGGETYNKIAGRIGYKGGPGRAKTVSKTNLNIQKFPKKAFVLPQKSDVLPGDEG